MPKCSICGKVVKKCDKCGKLIFTLEDLHQFNNGKQHSCTKCFDRWTKLGLFNRDIDIHKAIDEWFEKPNTETFIFR